LQTAAGFTNVIAVITFDSPKIREIKIKFESIF
jgi:hypothetical protein